MIILYYFIPVFNFYASFIQTVMQLTQIHASFSSCDRTSSGKDSAPGCSGTIHTVQPGTVHHGLGQDGEGSDGGEVEGGESSKCERVENVCPQRGLVVDRGI